MVMQSSSTLTHKLNRQQTSSTSTAVHHPISNVYPKTGLSREKENNFNLINSKNPHSKTLTKDLNSQSISQKPSSQNAQKPPAMRTKKLSNGGTSTTVIQPRSFSNHEIKLFSKNGAPQHSSTSLMHTQLANSSSTHISAGTTSGIIKPLNVIQSKLLKGSHS